MGGFRVMRGVQRRIAGFGVYRGAETGGREGMAGRVVSCDEWDLKGVSSKDWGGGG